jgi:hypothetical protein
MIEAYAAEAKSLPAIPATFDAETASLDELSRNGLPEKPDSKKYPQIYASWKLLVEAARYRVPSKLQSTAIYHAPAKDLRVGKRSTTGIFTGSSSSWSGYVIEDASNPFTRTFVYAAWTVPSAALCLVPSNVHKYASSWVGVDGYNSPDVLQTGTSSDIDCHGGIMGAPQYYAWFEWFPMPMIIYGGFPISAGDYVLAWAGWYGPNGGYTVTLWDKSRLRSVTNVLQPPPGTALLGHSIEWIVERPTVGGIISSLAPYAQDVWVNPVAYNINTKMGYVPSSAPSGTVYNLTMMDGANTLSTSTLYPGPPPLSGDLILFDCPCYDYRHP